MDEQEIKKRKSIPECCWMGMMMIVNAVRCIGVVVEAKAMYKIEE